MHICAIWDSRFVHSCALHPTLEFFYMYLMINISLFPQKLFETSLSPQFFLFVSFSAIGLTLLFFSKRKNWLFFFFTLSASSLPTMYFCLLLTLTSSNTFKWRCVSSTPVGQLCCSYFSYFLFWELCPLCLLSFLWIFNVVLCIDSS